MITYQVLNDIDRHMSSVHISGKYMACDKVVAEHNQAELSKLEAQTANSI